MLVDETMVSGESVGEFIWRMAKERILTEAYTDEIGTALGTTLAEKMPFKKFFPWKTMLTWVVDRALPEYGLLALRRVLGVAKLINESDPVFHIPNIDPPLDPLAPGGNA